MGERCCVPRREAEGGEGGKSPPQHVRVCCMSRRLACFDGLRHRLILCAYRHASRGCVLWTGGRAFFLQAPVQSCFCLAPRFRDFITPREPEGYVKYITGHPCYDPVKVSPLLHPALLTSVCIDAHGPPSCCAARPSTMDVRWQPWHCGPWPLHVQSTHLSRAPPLQPRTSSFQFGGRLSSTRAAHSWGELSCVCFFALRLFRSSFPFLSFPISSFPLMGRGD
jgi:hypothetical protein